MATFFELAEKRESCRSFSDKAPSKEQLIKCVETARLSPSACNSQPWSFAVINGGDAAKNVAKGTQRLGSNKFTDDCPAFIVVCEEKANLMAKLGGLVKDQHYAGFDLGLATAHICYAAAEQGLSSCIIGWFDEDKIKEAAGLPASKRVRLVIALGYAAKDTLRPKIRKDIDEIMKYIG